MHFEQKIAEKLFFLNVLLFIIFMNDELWIFKKVVFYKKCLFHGPLNQALCQFQRRLTILVCVDFNQKGEIPSGVFDVPNMRYFESIGTFSNTKINKSGCKSFSLIWYKWSQYPGLSQRVSAIVLRTFRPRKRYFQNRSSGAYCALNLVSLIIQWL